MANTNFLQFDSNKTNMLSDSSYSSDTQRLSGVSSGIARSNLYNKHAFQTSTMCKAIADFLVDNNVNAMDNNLTALKNSIASVFATISMDSQNVKITGNQTVSGSKTFTSGCYFTGGLNRKATWEVGVPPSGTVYIGVNLEDSTGTIYGSLRKQYNNNGSLFTQITATKPDGSTSENISIGYDSNGNAVATTSVYPYTTTATNSTQIATTGWVNTVGNNVMHLTGNESVAGDKTFTGKIIRKGSFTIGTLPSSNSQANIEFDDNANTVAGSVNTQYTTGGSLETRLRVRKIGTSGFDGITVGSDSSGNIYTYAPTPSSSTDDSTKIATTSWVYNWVSANGGFSSFSKSQNGYLKLGNGVIIQWGRNEVTASGGQTITLPTAFTNSNYKVVSENEASDGYGQLGITSRTTTNFTFNPNWAGTYAWIAIGY